MEIGFESFRVHTESIKSLSMGNREAFLIKGKVIGKVFVGMYRAFLVFIEINRNGYKGALPILEEQPK